MKPAATVTDNEQAAGEQALPEGARAPRRYGSWAGRPNGVAENPADCVEEIQERQRWPTFRQCRRKRGHGPGALYCRQHGEKHEKDEP